MILCGELLSQENKFTDILFYNIEVGTVFGHLNFMFQIGHKIEIDAICLCNKHSHTSVCVIDYAVV